MRERERESPILKREKEGVKQKSGREGREGREEDEGKAETKGRARRDDFEGREGRESCGWRGRANEAQRKREGRTRFSGLQKYMGCAFVG